MKQAFISYKSDEIEEAKWVKEKLESNGISCWMAPGDIPGGSSYAVEIPNAIKNAVVFVLVLSENTQNSQWVPKEIDMAINFKRTILPFMLEDFVLKDDFNFYLSNVQRYPAYEDKEAAAERMIAEIKAAIAAAAPPTIEKPPVTPLTEEKTDEEPQSAATPDVREQPRQATQQVTVIQPEILPAPALQAEVPAKPSVQNEVLVKEHKRKNRKAFPIIIGTVILVIAAIVLIALNSSVKICGEKYKTNTAYLTLEDQTVSMQDYNAILKLKKLRSLSFENCEIDAAAMSKLMADLHYNSLTMKNCGITDEILSAADFSNAAITELNLSENAITNISFLEPVIANITKLDLSNTEISDYSLLASATKLTELSLANNRIVDISFLSTATELSHLDIRHNLLTSLQALAPLEKISTLAVSDNQLNDLTGLEHALELTELVANNNKIASLDGIMNSTLLTAVYLDNNLLTDLSVLTKSAEHLNKISASGNLLEDVSVLAPCTAVQCLNLSDNQLKSLNGIENMHELTILAASNNSIEFLIPLKDCKKLTNIVLAGNEITLIDSLSSLNGEERVRLDLSDNNITNINDLPGIQYSDIYLQGNPLANYQHLASLEFYNLYVDYSENNGYAAFSGDDYKGGSLYLLNTPLDQQKSLEATIGSYSVNFITEDELQNKSYVAKTFIPEGEELPDESAANGAVSNVE